MIGSSDSPDEMPTSLKLEGHKSGGITKPVDMTHARAMNIQAVWKALTLEVMQTLSIGR